MILVVNADDAGVDLPRNRGILTAAGRGLVRSASLLVSFPAAPDFVAQAARQPGLGIGLHLNLTEREPLVSGHRSLTDGRGLFLGKRELARRSALGLIDIGEARREIEAQWRRLEELVRTPTHVDGHNHAHLLPGIAEALVETLPAGTPVRACLPRPGEEPAACGASAAPPGDPYASGETLLGWLTALTRRALGLGWGRFRLPPRFAGLTLPPGYSGGDLASLLVSLAGESAEPCELMTHPGEVCADSVPYSASPDRRAELDALTSPVALRAVRERGIRLASHGDLP